MSPIIISTGSLLKAKMRILLIHYRQDNIIATRKSLRNKFHDFQKNKISIKIRALSLIIQ